MFVRKVAIDFIWHKSTSSVHVVHRKCRIKTAVLSLRNAGTESRDETANATALAEKLQCSVDDVHNAFGKVTVKRMEQQFMIKRIQYLMADGITSAKLLDSPDILKIDDSMSCHVSY